MERPWIQSYPPGVAAEVDLSAYASIRDILEKSCDRFADLPAFTCMGATITYRELDRLSADFGSWLQNVAGLGKGARERAEPGEPDLLCRLRDGLRELLVDGRLARFRAGLRFPGCHDVLLGYPAPGPQRAGRLTHDGQSRREN